MTWLDEKRVNELLETEEKKRIFSLEKAGEIVKSASEQGRDLTEEETQAFEKYHNEAESIAVNADRIKKQYEAFANQISPVRQLVGKVEGSDSSDVKEFNRELKRMAQFALSSGGSTSGAELMQKLIPNVWDTKLRGSAPIFDCGFMEHTVDVSGSYPIPVFNGTGNTGSLITEGNAVSPADPATAGVVCQDYRYSAATVVSAQTLQSASANLASYLQADFQDQIVYQFSKRGLVTGTGTDSPASLVSVAGSGKAATDDTTITLAEVMETKYAMNSRYHNGGIWMMHGKTWGTIVQLILAESVANAVSITQGLEKSLDGNRVIINDEMDQIAASKKVALFFNPKYGHIKEVAPLSNLIVDGLTLGYNDQVRLIQHRYLGFCFTNADAAKYLITDDGA